MGREKSNLNSEPFAPSIKTQIRGLSQAGPTCPAGSVRVACAAAVAGTATFTVVPPPPGTTVAGFFTGAAERIDPWAWLRTSRMGWGAARAAPATPPGGAYLAAAAEVAAPAAAIAVPPPPDATAACASVSATALPEPGAPSRASWPGWGAARAAHAPPAAALARPSCGTRPAVDVAGFATAAAASAPLQRGAADACTPTDVFARVDPGAPPRGSQLGWRAALASLARTPGGTGLAAEHAAVSPAVPTALRPPPSPAAACLSAGAAAQSLGTG